MSLMGKINWNPLVALTLFFLSFGIGIWLSLRKPLWNDEIYTQVYSIDQHSYADIIFHRLVEGNNCPLFYLIQKSICDMSGYHFPLEWDYEWNLADSWSQLILRLSSNLFMSLSLALVFYYFATHYSTGVGVYSSLVFFSSYMVWAYWVEARPYALWLLLTTIQSLLFLKILKEKRMDSLIYLSLVFTHLSLSLTSTLSLAQISVVTLILWIKIDRNLKRYIVLSLIPLGICFYYYLNSPQFKFFFLDGMIDLIHANLPLERMVIIFLYGLFLLFSLNKSKIPFTAPTQVNKETNEEEELEGKGYFLLIILILLLTLVILFILKWKDTHGEVGFSISDRYFIYLTPVGIIATIVSSVHLVRGLRTYPWLLINCLMILGGLLIIRCLKTYADILALGIY